MKRVARPPLRQVFAANIKAAREARGLSQDELARLARLRHCRIDSVEAGTRNIDMANMARLADALGIELSDLCLMNTGPWTGAE
jgi:transcriptional regulator with XRE-family HTH domain